MRIGVVLFTVLFAIAISIAFVDARTDGQRGSADSAAEPYYVMSENPLVTAAIPIRHRFPGGVSADLTDRQVRMLERVGVGVEPVGIYTIAHHRPGHGGGPPSNGGDDENGDEPDRACYPSLQVPWGVELVTNGDPSGGESVVVAVLDTGVQQNHLDLKDRIVDCQTKVTRHRPDARSCTDGHGHGTHVAGSILADGGPDGEGIVGVAPEAGLMAIKVCDRRGWCYGDDIAAGIRYAADNGAQIISMSLGGSQMSAQEQSAIDYATEQGVLVIAAAGNSGPNLNTIGYPGAYHKVVAVGAIDAAERVPDFSSRGINADSFVAGEDRYLEIASPGVSVLSTWNDGCYAVASGTSMAAPHVSGIAARAWADASSMSAEDVRVYLQERAQEHDITAGAHAREGYDPASGFGLARVAS